jgi:hypothetical protein
MKKLIILLSLFILLWDSEISFAQVDRQTITPITSMVLPSNARHINANEAKTMAISEKSTILMYGAMKYYDVDGMLIGLSDKRQAVKTDYLKKMKDGLDNSASGTTIDFRSEIRVINNNEVFISSYTHKNIFHLNYMAVNQARTATAGGAIEALPGDSSKAQALLETMLSSLVITK